MAIFHGRVKTLGSSIVTSYQMTSGDINLKRSVRCSASLWKSPARSSQPRSLKFVTSTTSVSPSQRMAHPGIVGRALDLVQMDRARGIGEFVGDVNLVGALGDLERVGQVHR